MSEMNEPYEIHQTKKLHKIRNRAWWTIYLFVGVACLMSSLTIKYEYWYTQALWSVVVLGGTILTQNYITGLLHRARDIGDECGAMRMKESCQVGLGMAFQRGMETGELAHKAKGRNAIRKELLGSLDVLSDDPDIQMAQLLGVPEGIQWTKETMMLKALEAAASNHGKNPLTGSERHV